MGGKIVLNLAMSIDGYIADEQGGYAWITGQGDEAPDGGGEDDFARFLAGIDIVVMGKTSYDQGFAKDYEAKTVYVATHHPGQAGGNVRFISGDIVPLLQKEKEQGKNIYLFGGGKLVDNFIKENAIDEYIIGIIPVLLGRGRPLFLGNNPTVPLRVSHYTVRDGIAVFTYTKRE